MSVPGVHALVKNSTPKDNDISSCLTLEAPKLASVQRSCWPESFLGTLSAASTHSYNCPSLISWVPSSWPNPSKIQKLDGVGVKGTPQSVSGRNTPKQYNLVDVLTEYLTQDWAPHKTQS